jgi:phosphotriesterase-related protein
MSPYVQTVVGRVSPDDIGHTLPHEHILVDLANGANNAREVIGNTESSISVLTPETGALSRFGFTDIPAHYSGKWDEEITSKSYFDSVKNFVYYGNAYRLLDVEDAVDEVRHFQDAGGSCIVDCTAIGMGRAPEGLQIVARRTGLHLVMSTGFYLSPYHPPIVDRASEDELKDLLIEELTEGVYPGGPVPGMIKTALTSLDNKNEVKVVRAGMRAATESGRPITIHPGESHTAAFEVAQLVQEVDADPGRVIIAHTDHRVHSNEDFIELAKSGCYMALDGFGRESSIRQRGPIDLPNDAQRLTTIQAIIDAGHGEQVLVSQDAALKWMLRKWGGLGYGHIATNIVPLMRYKQYDEKTIELITRTNPLRAITISK